MKLFALLTITSLLIVPVFAETAVKSSAPFSFPTVVGVAWKVSSSGKDLSFVGHTRFSGRKIVELSWSMPGTMEKGSISIFNLAGATIKTFPVGSREGSVLWDAGSGKKAAKGIYFAKLTCGNYKKNVKIIIN
jgi:hypothetical protein